MADRFRMNKIAGILAAAIGLSAIVCGCGTKQNDGVVYSSQIVPVEIEEPAAPETQNDNVIEVNGEKYLVDFSEEDYENVSSINETIQYLYLNQSPSGEYFWLDTDLFKEEIAYANALVEAYNNGTCPVEIKEEVKLLAFLKEEYKSSKIYTWENLVAKLNSYYNICALQESADVEHNGGDLYNQENDCYGAVKTILYDRLKIENDNPIIYSMSKLIHEVCCDYKHTTMESGYSYCASLEDFLKTYDNEAQSGDRTTLRLTK